ncbi:MAG: succinate--CoA ligase subunit beta [Nitrospirota bacterium]|nr:succinate--CoA ligase subunit beta [Nitrospirota bacterium]
MNLYEHEAVANIYKKFKVPCPEFVVATEPNAEVAEFVRSRGGAVVKAMVLVGKRGKAGAVKLVKTPEEAAKAVTDIMGMLVWGEKPVAVMVCEKADIVAELYCAITYSTETRGPVITLSMEGGMDVEAIDPARIFTFPVKAQAEIEPFEIRNMLVKIGFCDKYAGVLRQASLTIAGIYKAFWGAECRLLEINPLAVVRVSKKDKKTGEMVTSLDLRALDAVVTLDDDATVAPQKTYGERSAYRREPTKREIDALQIDRDDHRGKAGSYVEPEDLGGDIAMMTFGGGGSAVTIETAYDAGLRPANFTDIGGNPPAEKMYRIGRIILSKPGLKGVLVCGGTASNTRIDVTLGEGLVNAIDDLAKEGKLDRELIWVVRRGGPEVEKGLKLLAECFKRNGIKGRIFDSELPITQAPLILRDLLVQHRGYKVSAPKVKKSAGH